jgi:hypothetical protein
LLKWIPDFVASEPHSPDNIFQQYEKSFRKRRYASESVYLLRREFLDQRA